MQQDIIGDDGHQEIVGDQLVGDDFAMGADADYGDDGYGDDGYGDQLVVGADDSSGDEYGADRRYRHRYHRRPMPRSAPRQRPQRQQLIQAHRMRHSKAVVSRGYTKSRVQSIGFQSLQVQPHTSADIPTKPQVLFRGTRLIVGSAIAPFFTIDDIKVGRTSQFVATGSQPAEAFKDTATGDNVSLDTCRPGMDIVLQVTNVSDTAQDFRAALFGDAIE